MRLAFVLLAALLASPALAADEPVTTAPATAVPAPTVADQIDAYLKTSPALEAAPPGAVDGVVPRDDGKVHGMVSVGVGTGGYRSIYMETDMPLGDSGRLRLAFGDERYGSGGPQRIYGAGPALRSVVDRQRCDLEDMSPVRPLDVTGGPHGRCVAPPR